MLAHLLPCRGLHEIISTKEYVRKNQQIMQNKPNFMRFSPENADITKKQTQFKPNQSQFWANIKGGKAKTNPIQSQFNEILKRKIIEIHRHNISNKTAS